MSSIWTKTDRNRTDFWMFSGLVDELRDVTFWLPANAREECEVTETTEGDRYGGASKITAVECD